MTTARLSDYQIVEIVKQTAKTSIVRDLTSYSKKTFRVKNSQLKEDKVIPLNEETAKTATLIIQIAHPEYGVQKFNYKEQPLSDGDFCHTWGVGSNSACLFKNEMKFWRVIK